MSLERRASTGCGTSRGASGIRPAGSHDAVLARMGAIRFRTRLEQRAPAAPLVVDDAQVAAVEEGAKRFALVATDGDNMWPALRGWETSRSYLSVKRYAVKLQLDTDSRPVDPPRGSWPKLSSPTPKVGQGSNPCRSLTVRNNARWIAEAKRGGDRATAFDQALHMIRAGTDAYVTCSPNRSVTQSLRAHIGPTIPYPSSGATPNDADCMIHDRSLVPVHGRAPEGSGSP